METTIQDILRAAGIEDIMDAAGINESAKTATKAVEFMNDADRKAEHSRLQPFVGKYVKFGKEFGMIDEIINLPYSVALGFITSDHDSWTGRVVNAEDITIAEGEDIAKCVKAALEYCMNEVVYLSNRIARHYKIDEPYLSKMQANLHRLDLLMDTLTIDNLPKH